MTAAAQFDLFTPADRRRLARQAEKVLAFFEAHRGTWLTLRQISNGTGAPEASASARFRDLKAASYPMERKPGTGGLHWYRMGVGA